MTVRLLIAIAVAIAACDNGDATPDWSRMITQPKALPFGATTLFRDGAAMRPIPTGTVGRDWIAKPEHRDGLTAEGKLVDTIPLPITRALLERGRDRFEITCAACHGVAGDGDTPVARAMRLRRPPSLHDAKYVALSPGYQFRVITLGDGLMPSYAVQLSIDDRWAVVAYLRTLQLSWHTALAQLPPAIANDLAARLP